MFGTQQPQKTDAPASAVAPMMTDELAQHIADRIIAAGSGARSADQIKLVILAASIDAGIPVAFKQG